MSMISGFVLSYACDGYLDLIKDWKSDLEILLSYP